MTPAAWLTLALTWAVIGYFAARFFLRVIGGRDRGPRGPEPDSDPV